MRSAMLDESVTGTYQAWRSRRFGQRWRRPERIVEPAAESASSHLTFSSSVPPRRPLLPSSRHASDILHAHAPSMHDPEVELVVTSVLLRCRFTILPSPILPNFLH